MTATEINEDSVPIEWGSDKLIKAQQTIDDNKWDIEAWGVLIREAQGRWINDVRSFFERLVSTFPTTGRYWKIYIEQEMKGRNYERVEKVCPVVTKICWISFLNIILFLATAGIFFFYFIALLILGRWFYVMYYFNHHLNKRQ